MNGLHVDAILRRREIGGVLPVMMNQVVQNRNREQGLEEGQKDST